MTSTDAPDDPAQKERIADCFKKHFEHFGYKKTSVDDIASELRISKKTIYKMFSTKEQIFYFVVSRVARGLSRKMEKQLAPLPGSRERVATLLTMIFAESRPWLRKNDAFEFKYKYEIASLAFKDAYGTLIEGLLEDGKAAGELSPELNVSMTVVFIEGMISESMKLLAANPELTLEDELVHSVLKLLA